MEVFGENCAHCMKLMPEINKVYNHYMGIHAPRRDIMVARMNGTKNPYLCDQLEIKEYPSLVLFRPRDYKFPVFFKFKSDYPTIKEFLDTMPLYDHRTGYSHAFKPPPYRPFGLQESKSLAKSN